ncbi:LysM peptidoglycan-binding domain-containing protein [Aquabacterium sp.]|uniref:LysM peptidoglycan-binding domain-containing protein n=1 Tax=Aquabacterium sp. TaxID=1872578 RepID=UPI0025C0F699|nr:LysM domain-containing protein [Aquabacterium sp.]
MHANQTIGWIWVMRAAAMACAGLLAACASHPPAGGQTAPVAPPPMVGPPVPSAPSAPPTQAAMQQAQKEAQSAVDELEDGHEDDARAALRRAVALDPNNKLALSLMRQLSIDPVMLLGKESFSYTVKPGESLSRIAGHFLGDIYLFYGLARYNDIKVPKQVAGGQVIRVPGKAPVEEREPPKAAKSAGKAGGKSGSKAEPKSEAKAEPSAPPTATTPTPAPVNVPAPAAVQPAEPAPAPVAPAPVAELSPGAKAMQSAQAAERGGNLDKALADYRLAASLGQAGAANKAEAVRKQLVDRHTQKARASMARQDLDGAIANWNRVLELDPGNDMARLEKQKALTLKEKIKALK